MRRYAIIVNDVIDNIILADSWSDSIDITDVTPVPSIGWKYINGLFSPPEPVIVVTPVTPTTPHMSHYGFLSRFTPRQRLNIRAKCNESKPEYDSTVDDALFLFGVAGHIDVTLQETHNFINHLIATGLLPVSDKEKILAEIPIDSPHAIIL